MNIKELNNVKKIEAFTGNFAVFSTYDDKDGIINRQGEILLPAEKYDVIFKEMNNNIYTLAIDSTPITDYFNADTREIVHLTTLEVYRAKNWPDNIVCIAGERGKGAFNLTTGKTVIPYENAIVSYRKQLHVILVMDHEKKYGLYDEDGNVILPQEYSFISLSNDRGLDEIAVKKNGECYFINAKQERIDLF